MIVPITVKRNDIFKTWIGCLDPILKLKRREKELLEKILLVYSVNKDKKDVDELLLSTQTRKAIRESLLPVMSAPSLNNHIFQLQNKGILEGGTLSKVIKDNLPSIGDSQLKIEYRVNIEDITV